MPTMLLLCLSAERGATEQECCMHAQLPMSLLYCAMQLLEIHTVYIYA
jgi:hypothetical protein